MRFIDSGKPSKRHHKSDTTGRFEGARKPASSPAPNSRFHKLELPCAAALVTLRHRSPQHCLVAVATQKRSDLETP
jgi:hypothetical protein